MNWMMIIQFIILQMVVFGVVIFFLRRTFLTSTEGAVKRLSKETEEARGKQAELDKKIKEANEELEKRRKEANELAKKIVNEAEEKAKEERDEVIKGARKEGEEIISKAQRTRDQMRKDVEQEVELRMITHAGEMLGQILSQKGREVLDKQLSMEFIDQLKNVDMGQIGSEVDTAEIVTAREIDPEIKDKIAGIIKDKLKREIKIETSVDEKALGGILLRFGSLALDASLQNLIIEQSSAIKEKVENA